MASRQEWESAMSSGDPGRILQAEEQLRRIAGMQEVYRRYRGDDTVSQLGTADYLVPDHIRNYMVSSRLMERWQASEQAAKDAGADQLVTLWNDIIRQYRERNEEPLANWKIAEKAGDQEEMMRLQALMQPLEIDPVTKGNMSQLAVQVDNAMKQASGGKYRLWSHPGLKGMTDWINREGAITQEGSPVSSLGPVGRFGAMVEGAAEAAQDLPLNLIYSTQAFLAQLTGGVIPEPPKNYIRDPATGALYVNQARPHPGIRELTQIGKSLLAGKTADQVFEDLTSLQEASEMEMAGRSTVEHVLQAGSGLAGAIVGMKPAIGAMAASTKGAKWFLEGGKFMAKNPKVANLLAASSGAALGNAATMAYAYGRQTDYASEALHGAATGLVLMAAGWVGHKTTERLLKTRKNMPKRIAQGIGGAVEGLGFSIPHTVENGLWDFLKNPSQEALGSLIGNVLGMAIFKAGARRSPMERILKYAEPAMQRTEARRVVAEKGGEAPVPGTEPQMRRLGELQMRMRRTGDPRERLYLERERERIEEELDVAEFSQREISRRRDEVYLPKTMQEGKAPGSATKRWGVRRQREGVFHEGEALSAMQGRPGKDPVVVPIRTGKVSAGAEGLYKSMENVVRTKGARDLITSAHEWAHAAHRVVFGDVQVGRFSKKVQVRPVHGEKYFEAMEKWSREFTEKEFHEIDKIMEGYDQTHLETMPQRIAEAFAEVTARMMMSDTRVYHEAPLLSARVDTLLRRHKPVYDQFERIQEQFELAEAVGAAGRFEGQVFGSAKREAKFAASTRGSFLKRTWTAFKREFYDDLAEVRASRDKWLAASGMKAADFDITADPARMKDVVRGTSAVIARQILEHQVIDPLGLRRPGVKPMRQVLDEANEAGISKQQLFGYVAAMRAIELAGKGIESGINVRDARVWLRENFPNKARREAAREYGRQFKDFTDSMVDYIQEAGVITAEEAVKIKNSNTFYVPFYRILPEGHKVGTRTGESAPRLARLRGGTSQIKDPMQSMYDMVQQMVLKAQQAKVQRALLNFAIIAKDKGGAGGFATIVPKSRIPNEVKAQEVLGKLMEKVTTVEEFDLIDALIETDVATEAVQIFGTKLFPHGERNTVPVRGIWSQAEIDMAQRVYGDRAAQEMVARNGKTVWLEMDARAYQGLMLGDTYNTFKSGWKKWILAKPAGLLRTAATGANPLFALRNTLRDMASKPVFSTHGWGGALGKTPFGMVGGAMDWVIGVGQVFSQNKGRDIYKNLGLEIGSFFNEGDVARIYSSEPVKASKLRYIVEKSLDVLGAPGKISESALRIKEINDVYKQALKDGATEQEAVLRAAEAGRDVTVNFAKGGATIRLFNQMTPYMKAGAVGQAKMFRSISSPEGAMRAAMSITVPSLILHYFNRDEEWYQDLPGWRRLGFWNFSIGDTVVSLPKPFELGTLFASIPEMMWDMAEGKMDFIDDFPEIKETAWQVLFPYLSEGVETFIPQVAKPLLEARWGYSSFKDRPITPSYLQGLPADLQKQPWTMPGLGKLYESPAINKTVWAILGINNPLELEHVLSGYMAGHPSRISSLFGDHEKFVAGIPLARMPFVYTTHQHSGTVDLFYEQLGEMRQLQRAERLSAGQQGELKLLERTATVMTRIRDKYRDDPETRNRLLFEAASKALR